MASVITSIRSTMGDSLWFVKLAFSVFIIYLAEKHLLNAVPDIEIKIICYALLGLWFFGCAVSAMHRNLHNKYPLFPGIFSIPEIITRLFGGLISIIPGVLSAAACFFIADRLQMEETNRIIFYCIIILLMLPFIVMPLVLYCTAGRISDAYRFDMINKGAGNFITNSVVYLIQFVLVYGISYAALYFFFQQMFNAEHISISLLNYTYIVSAFFTTMIYFSDLYGDIIPSFEQEEQEEYIHDSIIDD